MPTDIKTVVFICSGNYYRSRYCEYLFNAFAKKSGLNWRAVSRGLRAKTATNEGPISEFAAYRLVALGIPFDWRQFPVQLSKADLENADLVIALKRAEHHPLMARQFPVWADRITYWQIDDMDCATANEALPICESSVNDLVDKLLAEEDVQARLQRAAAG